MYQYLTDPPPPGPLVTIVVWWCSLFGINDIQTVKMVLAVIVGGALLGAAGLLVQFLLAFFLRVGRE